MLAGLESLVDKSLLQREEAEGEPRLRMLETVRAFAQERLSEAGEAEPLARRHLEYCVRRAEQAVPHLLGAEQPRWLEYLGHEYDDLRAALGRAVAAGAAAPALRLAAALWRFWYFRSDFTEGRGWLTRVLALPATAAQAEARAEALNGAGALAISQDDFAAARSLYEECLALRRAAGDRSGEARALNNLSVVAIAVADYPRAQALLKASLALHRAVGYRIGEAYNLNNLGLLRRGEGALAGGPGAAGGEPRPLREAGRRLGGRHGPVRPRRCPPRPRAPPSMPPGCTRRAWRAAGPWATGAAPG